jgi:hypothetical protein
LAAHHTHHCAAEWLPHLEYGTALLQSQRPGSGLIASEQTGIMAVSIVSIVDLLDDESHVVP